MPSINNFQCRITTCKDTSEHIHVVGWHACVVSVCVMCLVHDGLGVGVMAGMFVNSLYMLLIVQQPVLTADTEYYINFLYRHPS